jgi:multidrug efflux pump subunit AcrB
MRCRRPSPTSTTSIKYVNGQTVYVRDIGQVHDGWAVQQNIVRNEGRRSVLLSVLKNGNASTVAVVKGVRKVLEVARAAAPPGLSINELFDQSKLVTASIAGVVREGAIAAGLTGLMILLFLGSWRSTLVVLISIPLSILASIVVLYFLGHTLNTMTLGGMALAVGILVDDSTVTIENTHRLRGTGMSLAAATLHGSAGIAVPTMVSTLAISCVFTSVVFLEGPAKFLFTPLGLAVVFAMLASYVLSRTMTPIVIGLLLKGERHGEDSHGWFARFHAVFERGFERFRQGYVHVLALLLKRRLIVPVVALLMLTLGGVMLNMSAATSSRRSTVDRSSFTSASPRRLASKPPSASFRQSRTRSAKSFRCVIATSSSTTSACRSGHTTSPSPTAPPSASTTG